MTAVSQPNGDYESIKTVQSVDAASVRLKYSSEQLSTDMLAADFGQLRKTTVERVVQRADLLSASAYQQRFFSGMPLSIPGSTAIGTSAAVLDALRSTGAAELSISTAYSGETSADRDVRPNIYDFQVGTRLERVQAARVPVLVNGAIRELRAVVARGDFAGDRAEFVFLDDRDNPLTLKFRIGIDAVAPMSKEERELCQTIAANVPDAAALMSGFCGRTEGGDSEILQVVKISYQCADAQRAAGGGGSGAGATSGAGAGPAGAGAGLERSLAKTGRVDVYDIFFSFNSDRLRDESLPRLAEIAALLHKHPEWSLEVVGHTDAIGSDASNLDLSKRRAAAVKRALVERHRIVAARLATGGQGEAQPRDTNETLEGRARNRRVELIRRKESM